MENDGILILGGGVSGRAAKDLLRFVGKKCVIYDDSCPEEEKERILSARYGECVISPGFPTDGKVMRRILGRNPEISVIGETELGYGYFNGKIIAVTGTNGKTTEVSLLSHIISGKTDCVAAGNIGYPLSMVALDALKSDKNPPSVVLELSSFQLSGMKNFECEGAVVLNITPDHTDVHKTFGNYKKIKNSVYSFVKPRGFAVVNADEPEVECDFTGEKIFYSTEKSADCSVENGEVVFRGEKILPVSEVGLIGRHNLSNVLCAVCFSKKSGVENGVIREKIRSFRGLADRLEYVGAINGTKFYNDSKATNPDSAIKAAACFDKSETAIILGGSAKNADYSELFGEIAGMKAIILVGATSEEMKKTAEKVFCGKGIRALPETASDMCDAVRKAFYSGAKTVLLSPACASFDSYRNYAERGRDFIRCVKALAEMGNPTPDEKREQDFPLVEENLPAENLTERQKFRSFGGEDE